MLTFLFPPDAPDASFQPLFQEMAQFFRQDRPLPEGMAELHRILKKYFPLEYIMATVATERQGEERMFMFPEMTGMRKVALNSTPEQLLALGHGPERVVRLGNQDDHGITLGVIHRLFPERTFSALIIRAVIARRLIISFSLIGLEHRGGRAFQTGHVNAAFALLDDLMRYFGRHVSLESVGKEREKPGRFLPLVRLPGMHQVCEMIWQVSRQDCPVLLLGETGTGKEAVAETLYRASGRLDAPFIKMNCGSLPESLMESELFGHEKGAFTGAVASRKGFFERAHRGMLLLDEVGELSLPAQTRLLRVLQEGVLERVGGDEEHRIDVRIIAATHRNLDKMVQNGTFRSDLYFRLSVFPIAIPPLRRRPEDIPVLIRFFIARKCSEFCVQTLPEPSQENMKELLAYPWPGNLRELSNAVERAVILWMGDMRRPLVISPSARFMPQEQATDHIAASLGVPAVPERFETLNEAMARHILRALERAGGKISGKGGAAELLDVHPNTLRARMQKLGLWHGSLNIVKK